MIVSAECKSNMDDCRPPVIVGAHALVSVRLDGGGGGGPHVWLAAIDWHSVAVYYLECIEVCSAASQPGSTEPVVRVANIIALCC